MIPRKVVVLGAILSAVAAPTHMVVGHLVKPTGPGTPLSRRQYGAKWPLTVEEGVVLCDGCAITFRTGGRTYAVNGHAKEFYPWYPPIEKITRPNTNYLLLIEEGFKVGHRSAPTR